LAAFIDPGIASSWFEDAHPSLGSRALTPRSIAKAVPLRILCLGASITYGFRSTDGNGYRYALRGKLVEQGNDVNMIGAVRAGNMSNNNVDGWVGYEITHIADKAKLTLPNMPNVVLICAGSKSA
jgi:lysophospholipase L1-like esterase